METGRPCGVIFRCLSTASPGFSLNTDQCEVPPCYCGEQETSAATVQWVAASGSATLSDSLTSGLVKKGDLIQFNYQGPMYAIQAHGCRQQHHRQCTDTCRRRCKPKPADALDGNRVATPAVPDFPRIRSRAGPRRCNCPPLPSSISRRQATVSTTSASKT